MTLLQPCPVPSSTVLGRPVDGRSFDGGPVAKRPVASRPVDGRPVETRSVDEDWLADPRLLQAVADGPLGELSVRELRGLLAGPAVKVAGGEVLEAPERAARPVLMAAGRLRMTLLTPDDREITLPAPRAGDLLGVVPLVMTRVTATIEVHGTATLLPLRAAETAALVTGHAGMALMVVEEVGRRLRAVLPGAPTVRAAVSVRQRVAHYLVESCGGTTVGIRLVVASQQEIAESVGSVREVVNRAVRQLRGEGLVETSAEGIAVLDVIALQEVAAGPSQRRAC